MLALTPETLGWLAAGLTAATFACTDMLRLRVLALAANGAFIAYGATAGLAPVLALHLALAPLNAWHLLRLHRGRRALGPASRPDPAMPTGAATTPGPAAEPRPAAPRTALRRGPAGRRRMPRAHGAPPVGGARGPCAHRPHRRGCADPPPC